MHMQPACSQPAALRAIQLRILSQMLPLHWSLVLWSNFSPLPVLWTLEQNAPQSNPAPVLPFARCELSGYQRPRQPLSTALCAILQHDTGAGVQRVG